MNIDVTKLMNDNFIEYANEVNNNRAFPNALDGLKPVQRAALWTMFKNGMTSGKPHAKCAKISGAMVATFHPHGDQAAYEAFARMSKPWINNVVEIDWHGANGNQVIEDGVAAARYTGARLSKLAEDGMLQGIKKNNVPMILNFSEDEEWPRVLPALMPRLMLNGGSGIGYTIANVHLPHALSDLAPIIEKYAETGGLDYNNLAPDFPTGGVLINAKDMYKIYETGKGKVIVRAKAEVKGKEIHITEIPYQTYVESIIDEIRKLVSTDTIKGIEDVSNQSSKGKILLVIECSGNPDVVLNQLWAKTSLQKSYSANMMAIVDKYPVLLTLKTYLDAYLQHNYDCIRREYEYDLAKAKARQNILEGLLIALEDIDNVITIIKGADNTKDANAKLTAKYGLNEEQAKAVTGMRLGSLARLEKIELGKELEQVKLDVNNFSAIVDQQDKQRGVYLERFKAFCKKYATPRKTEKTHIEIVKETKAKIEPIPEDCVVVLTKGGDIKRVPQKSFKIQKRNGKGAKTDKDFVITTITTNTVDKVLLFSNAGRAYSLKVADIPESTSIGRGVNVASLLALGVKENIQIAASVEKDNQYEFIMFVTKCGMIKKTKLEEFQSITKRGTTGMKFKHEGDEIIYAALMNDEDLMMFSHHGNALRCETKAINPIGKIAMGVIGIKLGEGDFLKSATLVGDEGDILIVAEDGAGKRVSIGEFNTQGRASKGVQAVPKGNLIGGAVLCKEKDEVLIIGKPNTIGISVDDIPQQSRTTKGVLLIKDSVVERVVKI